MYLFRAANFLFRIPYFSCTCYANRAFSFIMGCSWVSVNVICEMNKLQVSLPYSFSYWAWHPVLKKIIQICSFCLTSKCRLSTLLKDLTQKWLPTKLPVWNFAAEFLMSYLITLTLRDLSLHQCWNNIAFKLALVEAMLVYLTVGLPVLDNLQCHFVH